MEQLILYQNPDSRELFYRGCKISKVTERWMFGIRVKDGRSVMFSISSTPVIEPLAVIAGPDTKRK